MSEVDGSGVSIPSYELPVRLDVPDVDAPGETKWGRARLSYHVPGLSLLAAVAIWLMRRFIFTTGFPAGTDMLGFISRAPQYASFSRIYDAWSPGSFGYRRVFNFDNIIGRPDPAHAEPGRDRDVRRCADVLRRGRGCLCAGVVLVPTPAGGYGCRAPVHGVAGGPHAMGKRTPQRRGHFLPGPGHVPHAVGLPGALHAQACHRVHPHHRPRPSRPPRPRAVRVSLPRPLRGGRRSPLATASEPG